MRVSRNIKILVVIFLCLTLAGCVNSRTPEQQLDNYIQKEYCKYNSPSSAISILIVDNGKIVYNKSYGYANIETLEKADSATNYRLASVTKMFTAMCAMILKDRGLLDYDTKVSDILEDFPEYGKDITVRQLLTHTSGLRDFYDLTDLLDEDFNEENQLLDSDVYEIVKRADSTYFTPGNHFKYSDTGYIVLGRVIEKVSGMTLSEFMDKNIFKPLKMNNTVAFDKRQNPEIKNRAYGTQLHGNKFIIKDQSYSSATLGDGGVYSSLEDLYKWNQALYSNILVSNETLEDAYTPAKYLNSLYDNYNCGWFFRKNTEGQMEQTHDGATQGFSTFFLRIPEKEQAIVVLSNRNNDQQAYELHKYIRKLYNFGDEV
ncbi:serine hydrolase domain-containing protein [Aminipila sp.]|uniref:serine hydrolase domain-containing protein n=1 Tax=Aminipila sp. TaxID=2060095 RepID=UPI00289ACC6F|nr:serine hydrolase [Aminipila sp.]